MKANFKHLGLGLCFGIATTAFSQITIDSNEINFNFGTERSDYVTDDFFPATFIGGTGGPQVWQFDTASYPNGTTQSLNFIDPATTNFAFDFPDANVCFMTADTTWGYTDFAFFELNSTGFWFQGQVYEEPPDPPEVFDYDQALEVLRFPLAMDSTWQSTGGVSSDFGIGNSVVIVFNEVSTVDAWGTVQTPLGTFDCLRIRHENTEIDSVFDYGSLIFVDSTFSISYEWFAEGIGLVARADIDETETYIEELSFAVFYNPIVSLKEPFSKIPETFSLSQNYPNPFNPSTKIDFSFNSGLGSGKILIYNLLGETVREFSVQGKTGSVVWDGSNQQNKPVSSGTYLYKLTDGNSFSETKKMLLLK